MKRNVIAHYFCYLFAKFLSIVYITLTLKMNYMKKTLLLLTALLCAGVPWQTAEAQRWTPSAPVDGGIYYLYNVGMRGYLVRSDTDRPTIGPAPIAGQTVQFHADGTNFRINSSGLSGVNDRWLVENWDTDYIYYNVEYSNNMHMPWKFTEISGKSHVYYITIVGGTDNGRRMEVDNRNNGVPKLDNRAGAVPYTRSTGSTNGSAGGGNLVAENDQWMLVTPEDYAASFEGCTDVTDKVGLTQADWTGSSEFSTVVTITTTDGRTTGIPAFYGSSAVGTKISQTVTGLSNGIYEVQVFAHSHNERAAHGTSAPPTGAPKGMKDVAYVFAESFNREEVFINARGRDPLSWVKAEYLAPYTISGITVKDGQITIGLGLAQANQTQWQGIQIYSLVRTGDLPLDDQIAAYQTSLATAQGKVNEAALPAGFRAALQTVIDNNSGSNAPSYNSAEELDAATLALNNAIVTAESSRFPYSRYLYFRGLAVAADDDTSVFTPTNVSVDVSAADAQVDAATTLEGINYAIELLRTAVKTFINSVTVTGKIDVSVLIVNADFDDNTIDGWTAEGSGTWRPMEWANGYGAEFWHGTRDIHQTITGLPAGRYEATVQATWSTTATSGFYLTAGITNSVQLQKEAETTEVPDALAAMNSDPTYARVAVSNTLVGNELTIGLKEKMFGTGECWTLFDNFHLYYYGVDYTDAEARLAAALATVPAAVALDIPQGAKDALNALSTTYTKESLELPERSFVENIAAFDAAIDDINTKVSTASDLVDTYAHYKYLYKDNEQNPIIAQTEVYTDEDGTKVATLKSALTTVNTAAEAATTVDALNTQIKALYDAYAEFVSATNIPGKYFDLTSLIYNPLFQLEKRTGWTKTGTATGLGKVTSGDITGHEYFNGGYDFYQLLPTLPAGTYKFNVNAFHRISVDENDARNADRNNIPALVCMNTSSVKMRSIQEGSATDLESGLAALADGQYLNELLYISDETMADVKIGLRLDQQLAERSWTLFTNFKLYYSVEDIDLFLEPYNEALAAAKDVDTTQPMNAAEKDELLAAIAADETLNKSNVASIQDATIRLNNATATALTSITAYAAAKVALDRIKAEMDATNVVTAEAIATFSAYQTVYDNGMLTDDEASALERRTFRDQDNINANTIDEYLLSAWKEGDTQMRDKEGALYINTWSVEPDVPGFVTPFYEVADGYHATTVAHTFKATVTDLEPGDYKVDIWARTRIKTNDVTNDNLPDNITFQLNDGTPVKLEGELYTDHFRAGNYTVYGRVGDDGVLVLTLNIPASSSQGVWLSFKNVKYTKIDVAKVDIDEDTDYTPEAGIANVTLTRTFNAKAWNTLVLPFEVKDVAAVFGSETKVARYTGATGENDLYTLNFEPSNSIPANEPVFIYGVSNTAPYSFAYVTIEKAEPVKVDVNINFVGSYDAVTQLPAGNFFIASDNKLYKVGENANVNLKGTRAYFQPVITNDIKGLRLSIDGTPTAITELTEESRQGTDDTYTLQGIKVDKVRKGVYIHNGKKVVIK